MCKISKKIYIYTQYRSLDSGGIRCFPRIYTFLTFHQVIYFYLSNSAHTIKAGVVLKV